MTADTASDRHPSELEQRWDAVAERVRRWEPTAARVRPWAELALVGLLLTVAFNMRGSTLDQPLVEAHSFRQAQTALTALIFHEEGIDLLHPKLPVLGDPGEVPFEFPLFQAVASVPMAYGVAPDVAMRATCLGFFLVTALLLWGLTRRLAGSIAAIVALVAFLFSPLNLLWSRTSLIEYLATAGAVAWLWAAVSWRDRRSGWIAALALAGGTIAMLVKPTTAMFWALPIIAYRPDEEAGQSLRQWVRARRNPLFACILLVPFLGAALWTRHADAIKEPRLATRWLTSRELTGWNFGTMDQRRSLDNWNVIGDRVRDLAVGVPLVVLAVVVLLALLHPRRVVIGAVVLSAVLAIAVFFNLYLVHDYYLTAITPQLAIVLGCAVAAVAATERKNGYTAVLAVIVVLWLLDLPHNDGSYWKVMYLDDPDVGGQLDLGAELAATTEPHDRIVFEGLTWSPVVPYYAHRTGMMLTPSILVPRLLDLLPKQHYNALLSVAYGSVTADVLDRWRWISSPSPHVYYLAAEPSDLRRSRLIATSDRTMPGSHEGRPLISGSLPLPCTGEAMAVPTGNGWTWMRFEADGRQGVLVDEAQAAAIPADRLIMVPPGNAGGPIHIRCLGGGTVTLTSAVDGPTPAGIKA